MLPGKEAKFRDGPFDLSSHILDFREGEALD
jgi:hypothetical protein